MGQQDQEGRWDDSSGVPRYLAKDSGASLSASSSSPASGSAAPGDDRSTRLPGSMAEAKEQASDIAQRATQQGKAMAEQKKDSAAEQVDSVAQALRKTAGELEQEHGQAGRYVGLAAEKLETFSRRLRQKDIDGLIDDAQELGRRSPGVLFAGSVAAGFLLARFLKSSADRGKRRAPVDWQDTEAPSSDGVMPDSAERAQSADVARSRDSGISRPPGSTGAALAPPGLGSSDIGGPQHGQV
jgi:hypothetical protein